MATHSSSRRSLLAALWSIVGLLTLTSFVIAILFAYASKKYDEAEGDKDEWSSQQQGSAIAVTSRAMVFAAIWTAVLSGILVIYGTVILGIRMPTGKYYACCAGNVHRMTPLSLGAFGGSLLMFANLTLVCAILFGEFEIRDFNFGSGNNQEEQNDQNDDGNNSVVVDQSSFAFSIMCIFFTVMYAAFAALVFYNSNLLLEESVADARDESASPGSNPEINNAPGYFGGDRFGVSRSYAKGTKNMEVL
eukprot:CAMPEP_0201903370 /NCGR_PEP_ID=MMETSP0902-20130614/55443_1 /ASSEMBLY_ACC=CAM_ASM_000551 /TAXON_ID=420261 /ORGANISM="Thalassiosira antarctica, Strain CCMP982" /LENGTH=247 /DNA_ID=CAMNT_0048437411 /DNA_START=44 /DNA_END=787 /DNA_ORIENTATION=-